MSENFQTSGKFIVLEASAGSGKTHNLAKRYITLLLNFDLPAQENIPLKNILALTFANKASVEMKERIIEYLKKISLGLDVGDLLSGLKLPRGKASENARAAMKFILEHYDNFNVKTIDSFINLIIKSCALTIGLSPDYKIEENDKEYIDFAIDAFLDNSLSDKKLERLLEDFFRQYLVDAHESWNIKDNISQEFGKLYADVKKSAKLLKTDYKNSDYRETLAKYSSQFYDCCLKMTKIKEFDGFDKRFSDNVRKITEKNNKYLLTNNTLSKYFQKEEVPYKAKAARSAGLDGLFSESREILKKFYEFKAFNYYNVYALMFGHIMDEFDRRSKKDSVVFLQDLNRKVLKIFDGDGIMTSEIYLRLSSYFRDFLIDEFQDTNQIQWKTLRLIVDENLSQDGSFFYVGDKKQAIYGFRGGDFKIFDQPLSEFARYNPSKVVLDTNYRSYKSVIDFNNSVFSKQNVKRFFEELTKNEYIENVPEYFDSIIDMFPDSGQKCSQDKSEGGYVEILSSEYSDEDEFNFKTRQYLYDTVDSLKERFKYSDITVICRNNRDIETVSGWLLEKNIPIESYQTLNIMNSEVIKELFSILKFLNSPADEISFACFITSSVFLNTVKLSKEEMLGFIYESSLNKAKNGMLYVLFREKYPEIWEKYAEPFFNSVGFIAVYELTASIISKFDVINNFKEDNNVVLRFLEVISNFETENQGLGNFIDYFQDIEKRKKDEDFFIKIPSSDAVKIITAHKAKGLQYNVVVMPYMSLDISSPEKPFNVQDGGQISFVNISKDPMTEYSEKLKEIYNKKYFKNLSDELNVLYVAMTRAVCEFYGLITEKKNKNEKKSPVNILIPDGLRKTGGKIKYFSAGGSKTGSLKLELSQMKDFAEIISQNTPEIYGKYGQDALLKGKIIHYILSNILTCGKDDMSAKLDKALDAASVEYSNENISIFKPLVEKVLSDSAVSKFFDSKNKVYNEKEFVDSNGNTVRIDKLVVNEDGVTVVDFKTSVYDFETVSVQMRRYLSVVKEIYPGKNCVCFVVDIEKNEVTEIK